MPADSPDYVEVATFANGTVLVALNNGNFTVSKHSPFVASQPTLSMLGESSVASTHSLLTAAFYAALKEQHDLGNSCHVELSLPGVILNLIGSYHTTHATPRLLHVAAERFRVLGRSSLVEFLEEKIREESGHDKLALKDLRALGLPAERLVEAIEPSIIVDLIGYFETAAHAPYPIATVGYSYALERNALFIRKEHIDAVQAVCPPGVDATRCLRVHSGTGADASHVVEMVEFIATLPADDRLAVLQAVYETMKIIAAPRREDLMTDGEIENLLEEATRSDGVCALT
jgi:hypothetical protein